MLEYYQQLGSKPSYQDSLQVLEADVHHANNLAASIPRSKCGDYLQMKLVHSNGKPSISCGRKATIGDFYAVILPSLQRLHCDLSDLGFTLEDDLSSEKTTKISNLDKEREDECGICLELCTKMVLPNCCHAMCNNCYRDWSTRSESCPFCRGSLTRAKSGDLWVLTSKNDVIDTQTVLEEDVIRFNLFINKLPKYIPESLFFVYYEYLI